MKKQSRSRMARFSPVFLAAIIGCSVAHGQDVKTRYMPGTDFSKYRTYCWVRTEGAGYPDQIIDTDIMRSVDSQMVAKGLTKADCGSSDSARAAGFPQPPDPSQLPAPPQLPGLSQPSGVPQPPGIPQPSGPRNTADSGHTADSSAHKADLLIAYHVAVRQETQWNGFGSFDRFPGGFGTASGTATSSTIEIGTLVLNMYDPAAKQLVWAGTATKTINISKKQEKNQKNLQKAMEKLLNDFPPTQR
jgi:hypothetical protein